LGVLKQELVLAVRRKELKDMARKEIEPPPLESREFRSPEEIEAAIAKLVRRVVELGKLDIAKGYQHSTGEIQAAQSNVRDTIRDVFGPNSPEFKEHQDFSLTREAGYMLDSQSAIETIKDSRTRSLGILNGLIGRLREKQADLGGDATPIPSSYFDRLNLHPRIREVSRDLFLDGHHWEAVFAASKALVNYVKERSGRHDLDGTPLVQAVFSKNNPVLAFNDLLDKTDLDEQEGMMHMFEGAVQAIRNPGGHDFPEGPEQRAIEYISFLSLLAYRLQDSKRRK
jgi:uncharacterized protein (TIGR02391 family)